MTRAEINSGVCGFTTTVIAKMDDDVVRLEIKSDCEAIQRLANELTEVNPYKEISTRKGIPQTLQLGMKYCTHAACPVAVGIIKAIEVEAGLALPANVSIQLFKNAE